jgi:hypothetical protein
MEQQFICIKEKHLYTMCHVSMNASVKKDAIAGSNLAWTIYVLKYYLFMYIAQGNWALFNVIRDDSHIKMKKTNSIPVY